MKCYKVMVFIISIILLSTIGFSSVVDANQDESEKKDVVVVYQNEEGKEKVLEKSIEVDYEFETVPAISATITEKNLEKLEKDPNIKYVEENISFSVLGSSSEESLDDFDNLSSEQSEYQWNVKAVNAQEAWKEGYTGKGVKVAVLDSGITPHSELNIAGGVSTVDYTSSWRDDFGHGTHVAGIIGAKQGGQTVNGLDITGVAPNVELYAVKVMNKRGNGELQDVLEGLDWAIKNKMDIINMSFGSESDSQLLHEMVDKAYQEGIILVGASGNDGNHTTVNYPAKYNSVIAVSSVDKNLNLSDFASVGKEVEFAAPGEEIISTSFLGKYIKESGTSQAAPHVTGMLALLAEKYPSLTNVELREMLQNYVKDIGPDGRDSSYGYGLIYYDSTFDDKEDPPLDEETLKKVEKAVQEISYADQTRKLWDYDSARYTISQLPDGTKKRGLEKSLKELQNTLGLVEFASIYNVEADQDFLITFTTKIDAASVNEENVFVRKDGQFVQGITREAGSDEKTVVVHAPLEGFQHGGTYFIYIDRSITGVNGKNLKFPVVVMFTVK